MKLFSRWEGGQSEAVQFSFDHMLVKITQVYNQSATRMRKAFCYFSVSEHEYGDKIS